MGSQRIDLPNELVENDVINYSYEHSYIYNMSAKNIKFSNVNFKYCIIDDCYFHKAEFVKCDFTGTIIRRSNFRNALFKNCTFDYASFDNTIIPYDKIIPNLPIHENMRRMILKNLQINANQTGEHEIIGKLAIEEMKAVTTHYKKAFMRKEGYYDKYIGFERVKCFFKYLGLVTRRILWNHGFSYWRVIFFSEIVLGIGSLTTLSQSISKSITFSDLCRKYWLIFSESNKIFLDIIGNTVVYCNETSVALIVILRYLVIGLIINIFYMKNIKK